MWDFHHEERLDIPDKELQATTSWSGGTEIPVTPPHWSFKGGPYSLAELQVYTSQKQIKSSFQFTFFIIQTLMTVYNARLLKKIRMKPRLKKK